MCHHLYEKSHSEIAVFDFFVFARDFSVFAGNEVTKQSRGARAEVNLLILPSPLNSPLPLGDRYGFIALRIKSLYKNKSKVILSISKDLEYLLVFLLNLARLSLNELLELSIKSVSLFVLHRGEFTCSSIARNRPLCRLFRNRSHGRIRDVFAVPYGCMDCFLTTG